MISVQEAFRKFKSKLELTQGEQDQASRRQKELRELMSSSFNVKDDFLTGSYRRWTKTKPLKDVDIFCVFGEGEEAYRSGPPAKLLEDVERALSVKYERVSRQRRSVTVGFDAPSSSGDDDRILSFDVVPAFAKGAHYEIPDTSVSSGWTETDPRVHADKATEANEAYGGEWKALVRMMKAWNNNGEKPIKPSFLIEVIALEALVGGWGGDFRREMQGFFATLGDRILEDWPDPAGLGPPVSDSMNVQQRRHAAQKLQAAERQAAYAIRLEREGKQGAALEAWRELLGPYFPLS